MMTNKEIEHYGRIIENLRSKWLEIHMHAHTGKTFQFTVWTTGQEFMLGDIKWFGRWRRYAFSPVDKTIFEQDCLRTIADICEKMTKDHNKKYEILHNLRGEQINSLAAKIVHLEAALDQANKNAAKDGKLGVGPDSSVSFRESNAFRKKIKRVLDETA